jgi:hypothetical protein
MAMIDLWRQRPADALQHTEQAAALEARGGIRLRLVGLRARALAQLGRSTEADALMRVLEHDGDETTGYGPLADLGPAFSFPSTRRHYYAAVNYAHLRDRPGVERSVAALGHDDARPPQGDEAWPISWALSRSYLALARLDGDGDPDAAADALRPVLSLPPAQRINQLSQVLGTIRWQLEAGQYRDTPTAKATVGAIRQFHSAATPALGSQQ